MVMSDMVDGASKRDAVSESLWEDPLTVGDRSAVCQAVGIRVSSGAEKFEYGRLKKKRKKEREKKRKKKEREQARRIAVIPKEREKNVKRGLSRVNWLL